MRQKLLSIAQRIRLPSICVLCNQTHAQNLAVCDACIHLFTFLDPACKQCSLPVVDSSYLLCGQCIKKPPYFDSTTIAYSYEEPLASLVRQFKYQNKLYLSAFLAQLIINAWAKKPTYPQCLIPIPMHDKKLKKRGFNQTIILSRFLSKQLKIPIDLTSCQKVLNTEPQAELTSNQRAQNIKNAFSVSPLPYSHVALIDDLLTTGSTANELAKKLKESGITTVEVWCCARTIKT